MHKVILFVNLLCVASKLYSFSFKGPKHLKNVTSSIEFKQVSTNKVLYSTNPNKILTPASVTKLFIAVSVLDKFGANYTPKTHVYYTKSIKNKAILGDLYIVGSGDPYLVSEKLFEFATNLKSLGIKQINGNIIIDNSLFDNRYFDSSRKSARYKSSNAYDAPISALSVNFNTVTLAVSSFTKKLRPLVNFYPYNLDNLAIDNRIKIKNIKMNNIKVQRFTRKKTQKFTLSGQIKKTSSLVKVYRSVNDPIINAGNYIKAFLLDQGIQVKGKISSKKLAKESKHLVTIIGYPLKKAVQGMNTYSNNFIADMLLKKIPLDESTDKIGTTEGGLKYLSTFMKDKLKIKNKFTILNASGLDANNKLSANQINLLLIHPTKKFEYFSEFLSSLPVAGQSGTLKKRFLHENMLGLRKNIRAKTGTLTEPLSVVSIAGYLKHKKYGLVVFTIIMNGLKNKKQPNILEMRNYQDRFIIDFLKYNN